MIELRKLTGKTLQIRIPDLEVDIQWRTKKHRPKRIEMEDAQGRKHKPIVIATTQCFLRDKGGALLGVGATFCSVTEPRLLVTKARFESLDRALRASVGFDKKVRTQLYVELLKALPPESSKFTQEDVLQGKRVRKIFLKQEKLARRRT